MGQDAVVGTTRQRRMRRGRAGVPATMCAAVLCAVVLCSAAACTSGSGSTGDGAAGADAAGDRSTTSAVAAGDPADDAAGRLPVPVVEDVDDDAGFVIGARTGPYAVTYRVVDHAGDDETVTAERLVVDAPFVGLLEQYAGPSSVGEPASRQVSARDRITLGTSGLTVFRVPVGTPSDVRVAPLLERAVADGRLRLAGQRTVDGRRCQVVESAELLGAGPLLPLPEPGPDDTSTDDVNPETVNPDDVNPADTSSSAETCIDADGIVLDETLFLDGELSLRRTAVDVDTGVDLDDPALVEALFVEAVVVPADQGGGSVLPVEPDAGAEGAFWVVPESVTGTDGLLDGYGYEGRFAVIPPQPERFSEEVDAGSPIAGTADVYRAGPDVVVVYQGSTQLGDRPFADEPAAIAVDLGALGPGVLLLDATGSEVRADRGDGDFVHVVGTTPPDVLERIARALVITEGTGLVYR